MIRRLISRFAGGATRTRGRTGGRARGGAGGGGSGARLGAVVERFLRRRR